jgi:hypothetical protein
MFRRGFWISSPSSTAAFAPRIVKVSIAEATANPPAPPGNRGTRFCAEMRGKPIAKNTSSAASRTATITACAHIATRAPRRLAR